jgi:hypothetical protein
MKTTFVTAYLKVYDEEYDISRTFDNRLKHFMLLLELDINICIFVEPDLRERFEELQTKYRNLKVLDYIKIEDLELYKIGDNNHELCNLPANRNRDKDTKKYMFLILSKLEFLKKTIDVNPFDSNVFCWLDFSLPYVFKDLNNTLPKIKNISTKKFKDDFIYIPGCWNFKVNDINYIKNNVVWRFCGGVLIGDKNSLNHFYKVSHDYFLKFLNETRTLVWEVNYWAWLESIGLISPTWCLADHNDTIIDIPNI